MEKTTKLSKRSIGVRTLIVVGDILLSGFLIWETWALISQSTSIRESLSGSILAGNEAEFIAKLESQLPSIFIWILVVGGLVVTFSLILGILLTKNRLNKIVTRVNAVWLLAWLTLGIYWIVVFVSLLARLRDMFG